MKSAPAAMRKYGTNLSEARSPGLCPRTESACLNSMTPECIDALLRLAGLETTREKYPEDVEEAAAAAAAIRAALLRTPGPDPDGSGASWPPPFAEDCA